MDNNLDLNATARKSERTIEKSSPYLVNATYFIISVDIAVPIGSFNEKNELKAIQKAWDQKAREEAEAAGEAPPVEPEAPAEGKGEQEAPAEVVDDDGIPDENEAIYERAVYLMPYKSSELLNKIYRSIERINLDGVGETESNNVRVLNTKQLSDEERSNRKLDIIGGFEFIDSEFRIVVLEGLGGKDHGMNWFYTSNMRKAPNSRRCKLLYNPEIWFKNRLYLDFNVNIKKIKLRDTLTSIMASPDIYLRSKVP